MERNGNGLRSQIILISQQKEIMYIVHLSVSQFEFIVLLTIHHVYKQELNGDCKMQTCNMLIVLTNLPPNKY